jgi:hypothetical protein
MMKFYQIDADSENYFVGRMERAPEQLRAHLSSLKIGETWWDPASPNLGFERYA